MKRIYRLVSVLIVLAWAAPAAAQQNGDPELQRMIDELNALIEKGETERLADPWYLRDLQDLANKYDNPWRQPLYSEEFQQDGSPPAPWRVVQGEMRVDWRYGLRSLVRNPQPAQASEPTEDAQQQETDPGRAILGAVLRGVLKDNSNDGRNDPQQTTRDGARNDDTRPALAVAETRITNAFSMDAEWTMRALSDGTAPGASLGVYQDLGGSLAGYRLSFAGVGDSLALERVNSRGGRSILAYAAEPATLDDGNPHSVTWTRDRDGGMVVTVDGADLIKTVDRAFGDPWHGLVLHNEAGDVSLRRIAVMGTQ